MKHAVAMKLCRELSHSPGNHAPKDFDIAGGHFRDQWADGFVEGDGTFEFGDDQEGLGKKAWAETFTGGDYMRNRNPEGTGGFQVLPFHRPGRVGTGFGENGQDSLLKTETLKFLEIGMNVTAIGMVEPDPGGGSALFGMEPVATFDGHAIVGGPVARKVFVGRIQPDPAAASAEPIQ
jgi:hypothetical protein